MGIQELAYCPMEVDPTNEIVYRTIPVSVVHDIARKTDPLVQPYGILASAPKEDPFGRPFGRDAAIYAQLHHETLAFDASLDRSSAVASAILQMLQYVAKEDVPEANIYRGDVPHERGTVDAGFPAHWYRNKDGIGESFDSADATDRMLNVAYAMVHHKPELYARLLPSVVLMTSYVIQNTERFGGSGYIGATQEIAMGKRKYPGLDAHGWRDKATSRIHADGSDPIHPLRGVEEQALRWAALLKASDLLAYTHPALSKKARYTAFELQTWFNNAFPYTDKNGTYLADAIDGEGRQLQVVSADALAVLAPRYNGQSIISDPELVWAIVQRGFEELFDDRGGLRTVTTSHPLNIYHGKDSIWPQEQAHIVQGLVGEASFYYDTQPDVSVAYTNAAVVLAQAAVRPAVYFETPIETAQLLPNGGIDVYRQERNEYGVRRVSSAVQAWTGAALDYCAAYLRSKGIRDIFVYQQEHGVPQFERNGASAFAQAA